MRALPKPPARLKSCVNITTVSIHPDDEARLRAAFKHFRIDNIAAFYRTCSRALMEHHERGDQLLAPLLFRTASNENTTRTQKYRIRPGRTN